MADISKIAANGTTYNIKDSTARTSLSSIATASNFVTKGRVWGSQISLASGSNYFNQTINVSMSGWTPICITGFGVTNGDNGNYYQWCTAYKGYLSSTSQAVIYIRHFATQVTVSVKPYVDVIWRRN